MAGSANGKRLGAGLRACVLEIFLQQMLKYSDENEKSQELLRFLRVYFTENLDEIESV